MLPLWLEFGLPVLAAILLGTVIGYLLPGPLRFSRRGAALGTFGSLLGLLAGYVIALYILRSPGTVNLACLAVGAVAGAIGSVLVPR